MLPSLVPPRHIDDCGVTHILHEELCDPQLSSRQNFPLWARLYQHVFCKKPSLFLSSSRYRYLGPSESEQRKNAYTMLTRNQVPLLLATPLAIHEQNWKCLDIQAQGFPVALRDYVHRQSGKSCNRFALYFLASFISICVFGFCWFMQRFLRSSSLVLPLLSGTGFSVSANVKYRIL